LVERVFLRIGSAETDDQLETSLSKFLTPVLIKLNSKDEAVRKKVMELLVHINKRLKSRPKVLLPVESLIQQYRDPEATSIITVILWNFSIIYIRMGYPRLDGVKQAELLPLMLSCLEGKPKAQQDSLLLLVMPALSHVTMPSDMADRKTKFAEALKPDVTKVLLDYMMDMLILPYNAKAIMSQSQRPSTAPVGGASPATATFVPPPAMNEYAFRRVTGDNPLAPEDLEKAKIGIIKFLGADLFKEEEVVCHYVIAAADTRHGSVDWNCISIINRLYSLFQGTIDVKGQPPTKAELKRKPSCTRIRLKIFPFLLKSREAGAVLPSCIQVIFDCLYGQNTNAKLKNMAVQFVHHVCLNCPEAKFSAISPVLLTGMVKLIGEAQDDGRLRNLAYVAVGKIVRRSPHLVSKDVGLVQKFFDAMSQEDSETKLAIQESLSLMSDAFKNIDSANQKLMEALLMQNIEKDQPQARMMSVQYARTVFPSDHVPSRYILLLACGDMKEDIKVEATKSLRGIMSKSKVNMKVPSQPETCPTLPNFTDMMEYIHKQSTLRMSSQKRYVIGNHTLPFVPAAYEEMILYLRMCLAAGSGITPDMESLSAMQDQAPLVARHVKHILSENSTNSAPIILYLEFIKKFLSAVGGAPAMYCLLELVAVAPDKLAPQFLSQIDWITSYINSSKEDLKDYASQLYAIVICSQPDQAKVLESVETLVKNYVEKSFEAQQGAVIALGYLIGHILYRKDPNDVDQQLVTLMKSAVLKIATILKSASETTVTMTGSACLALGEMGRRSSLLLPPGGEGDQEGEITQLWLINTLLRMIRSSSQPNKTKEKSSVCLGYMCVGEREFPYRQKVMEELMDSAQPKQIELHLTTAEALVYAAQGTTSPAGRDMWTETEDDFKKRVSQEGDTKIEWYLEQLLKKYIRSPNPHLRQAAVIWLLALVKKCGYHSALQGQLSQIQAAFMSMLSENDDTTQDIASKGLGLVYDICTPQQKDSLVSELVDTLTTGKRAKQEVTGDTKVFEEGSMGKTPEGGGLSTYKELCSIANDLNQPDLIYKFMHLANHNAMWNSRKGAAFGFGTIAAQAGEQLAPYLHQIVPKLYRYQFDPNPKIQQAMSSIWSALVQDNKNAVDKYIKEILYDLIKNLTNNQWRVRESSCLAVNDLLRGRPLDDVVEQLPELWETCLRVRDDIKASIKICDINYGKLGEKATSLVLPCLLKCSIESSVPEVRAIGLSTMLKISKNAGSLLKPHIPILVTALLEAVSGLEPQVLNYFSLRVGDNQATQERLDSARIAASKMSPMMETVNYCVQYVDDSVLVELVPRLCDLIKSGIGIGTKAGCSSFVVSLVHHCPKDLTPFAGKLMSAFLSGLGDRNSSVRKSYSSALGQLVKVAKDSSVEKLIIKLRSWYLEKEEESARHACGQTLHAMSTHSPDILKRHATLAMPLAFFAMHEKKSGKYTFMKKKRLKKHSDDNLSIWEEVWLEVTPGTEAGLRLYIQEIVQLLGETIESQSWNTKAQAASAMSTVASKLQSNLGHPHLGKLLTALLTGLQGRTWTGKEALLQAIDTVCTFCKGAITDGNEGQPTLTQITEAVMKECRKDNVTYKLEACRCMGNILELYSVDRFSDMWNIFSPVLLKDDKKDDDEDEIKPNMTQSRLECYYEVLGQAWPVEKVTQDGFCDRYCDLMCTSYAVNTWKVQVIILKMMCKFIERSVNVTIYICTTNVFP
ncbi:hypothetical protein FSP39_020174, partial [Pinctada imbricata]